MEFPSNNLQAEVDVSTFSEKFMGWKIRGLDKRQRNICHMAFLCLF